MLNSLPGFNYKTSEQSFLGKNNIILLVKIEPLAQVNTS